MAKRGARLRAGPPLETGDLLHAADVVEQTARNIESRARRSMPVVRIAADELCEFAAVLRGAGQFLREGADALADALDDAARGGDRP